MKVILVRGVPGSGKSTFAKKFGAFHIEADLFCMRDGKYVYNAKNNRVNHIRCLKLALACLRCKCDVVVSNTFIKTASMEPFIKLAKRAKATVEVYRMDSNYGSIHDVPDAVIENMGRNIQPWEGEIIVNEQDAE